MFNTDKITKKPPKLSAIRHTKLSKVTYQLVIWYNNQETREKSISYKRKLRM